MPQPAVPQPKKFVYLKSVLPDMRCQFITFLVEEADRAAAGRAAAEKVCVPKIGLARHALPRCKEDIYKKVTDESMKILGKVMSKSEQYLKKQKVIGSRRESM